MAKLTKDETLTAIYSELSRAVDFSTSSLKENRQQAWNYYLNRNRGDEIEGRSTVQDTTVRDVVHALMAAIMPAYATDHIINLEPFGPDDIDQAEAESRAVNSLFTETNQGYLELSNAIQDALLFRNGVIKIWVEEREEVSHRRFNAPAADVLAQAPEGQEWTHLGSDDNGINEFEIKADVQSLKTEAIEQAYIYLDPNQQDQDISEAEFISELVYFSRSELIQMGISKRTVKELPATPDRSTPAGTGASTGDITAKFIDSISDVHGASTEDREQVECYWIHMKIDRDGDGISERWRFLVSAREMLIDDRVDFFPYASGTAWPVPHRWSGLSVYDLNRITQDERTNARRQLADNLNVANNQRPVFDPGTTEAVDITNGAPGRGIRSRDPAGVHFMPVADIVGNSIQFLQYMDGVRSEQSGAALDMQSADGQLLSTASGISAEMQLAPRELMAAHISRNIAETLVRNLFLLIHRTLRTQWNQPVMFSKAGDWQATDPTQWQSRTRLNVNVGLSPGERRRKSSALQTVLQMQLQQIEGGNANITTNLNGYHSAVMDWMRSVELDSHEGYFLDPQGKESQAGQQAAQQAAQQQQAKAAELEQFQKQLIGMQNQLEQQKLTEDRRQHDTELQFKYFDSILDNDATTESERIKQETSERTARLTGANGAG